MPRAALSAAPPTCLRFALPALSSLFVFVAALSIARAQTTTHLYRYEVRLNTRDTGYRGEIPSTATPSGSYYKVEKDALGRSRRVAKFRDGRELSFDIYHYAGNSRYSDYCETYTNGEKTQIQQYQRNAWGMITREDDKTVEGTLTQYSLAEGTSTSVETWWYTSADARTSHSIRQFGPSGAMIHSTSYSSAASTASYVDSEIDEQTGLTKSSSQYSDGTLTNTKKYTYNSNGDILRADAYNPTGVWYSADEFSGGLRTRRLYKYLNGSSFEIRYAYDEKQWLKQSDLYLADRLVCTLTYDRASDGNIKRSLAVGPDGSLWAEYPPPIVTDLQRNGQPVSRSDGSIHHTGDWW